MTETSVSLGGMRDGIPDERENVIVGDAVDDALAVSLAIDQSGAVQYLQARRNGGQFLAFQGGDFRNA